jgi:hypothetical protein
MENYLRRKTMDKWIKINCKKDLPERDKEVLVYYRMGENECIFVASLNKHFECWDSISDESDDIFSITHWMPLPEAPENTNE